MNGPFFAGRGVRVCCCVLGLCWMLAVPCQALAQEARDQVLAEPTTAASKRGSAIADSAQRPDLAQTSDLTAAEASQRVLGATVVDGQIVYARGMDTRYTNALLNGVPLASMDTDHERVPLDLFPALALESLTITRQFLPDVPGDFAAGSVQIRTRDFPDQPLFQLSLSGAYNTASTGQKRPSYAGSSTDWLGFDGGRRSFPSGIPNQKLDAASTSTAQQIEYGHRINTPLVTFMKATPPNFGLKLVAGNSYRLAPDAKLGVMIALSYGRSYQSEQLTQRTFVQGMLPDGTHALLVGQEYSGSRTIDNVRWGTLGSASLELSPRHTLSVLGFHGQNADDSTSDLESPGASGIHATHLEYVSHSLNVLQLRGEHHFPQLSGLEIDWQTSLGSAGRDQPDTRDVRYQRGERDGTPGWNFIADSSGE
ncbi:MAG TPA: TonB-dependent receptor plug domain-containing protein, partial [Polyangiaceae bacterium]